VEKGQPLATIHARDAASAEAAANGVLAAVRIGERFRWPAAQTLLVGIGLVPWPVPAQNTPVAALVPDARRRDVAVVVEPRLRGGP
jgi:hypothetical protein